MDEDVRTLWCGNLSEKVTEHLLYELFLQGGPIQRVSIPKDRDGKQKTYGFVTYKHVKSVLYALDLFDGTMLYNRPLSMKTRNNVEQLPQPEKPDPNFNQALQTGHQMILGNFASHVTLDVYGINVLPDAIKCTSQVDDSYLCKDGKRFKRIPPYRWKYQKNHVADWYREYKTRKRDSCNRVNDYPKRNNYKTYR